MVLLEIHKGASLPVYSVYNQLRTRAGVINREDAAKQQVYISSDDKCQKIGHSDPVVFVYVVVCNMKHGNAAIQKYR